MPGCVINLAWTRGKVSWNAKTYNRTKIVSILDTFLSIFDSAHTNLWNFLLVGLTLYAFIALSCITSICISRFAFIKDVYQTQKFVLAPTRTRSPTFRSTNHIHLYSAYHLRNALDHVWAQDACKEIPHSTLFSLALSSGRAHLPKSRASSRINISMIAVVILSVRFSPIAVLLSNNGCRRTKIGIEFDQHVSMISFAVQ